MSDKYYIYFNNWWGGFYNKTDGNNIGFFERLLPFTKLKNFEITNDVNKGNVLIEAGKPTDNIINMKKWKIKMNFIGEPVFPGYEKYDIVTNEHYNKYDIALTSINNIDNVVDLPISIMYTLCNNFIPRLINRPPITRIPPYFCCFIVSNPRCEERNKMFHLLNKYKKVNSGGNYCNNIGNTISYPWWSAEFLKFISMHKFMICFENSKMETYSTEKIVNTYLSSSVPIYWSSDNIKNIFNPDSMLFVENETDEAFDHVVKQVIELDNNDEKYLEFINRPIFNEHNKDFWNKNYTYESLGEKMNKLINC